ncbi:MAG: hypothetical protein ACI9FU_001385 [Granulosicoccus sp.]
MSPNTKYWPVFIILVLTSVLGSAILTAYAFDIDVMCEQSWLEVEFEDERETEEKEENDERKESFSSTGLGLNAPYSISLVAYGSCSSNISIECIEELLDPPESS